MVVQAYFHLLIFYSKNSNVGSLDSTARIFLIFESTWKTLRHAISTMY